MKRGRDPVKLANMSSQRPGIFRFLVASPGLLLSAFSPSSAAAQQVGLPKVFTAPIAIERADPVATLPFEITAEKLKIEASVNGVPGRYVFDTGSPTILARPVADRLGLEIVGQNTGKDANGAPVVMDVAVVDRLTLGDTTFRNVPVLIFDFAGLPMASCFIGDGVIGSEIFPGSAWRIDAEAREIRIAESASALGVSEDTPHAPLSDFGYPHAPIIDYSIGKMQDKALFDTGSASVLSLFSKAMDSPDVKTATARGSVRKGSGSEGISAGGQGDIVDLSTLQLKSLQLGSVSLEGVYAQSRQAPPSLVGAGLLSSHVVTLDYPGKRLLVEPRTVPEVSARPRDYGIAYVDGAGEVTQLYENGGAKRAGLRLGDRVTSINGRSLLAADEDGQCAAALWLADEFDATQAATLTIDRQGSEETLQLPVAAD